MSEALIPQLDKDMVRLIQETTKARALALHGALMDRLETILNGEDDKTALTAAGLILKIGGSMKERTMKVHHTFDELMKQPAVEAGPLSGLTQIAEASVIDAEEDGDDTSE